MSPTMDERIDAALVPGGRTIASDPYPWPFDGDFRPQNTALVVIDMQTDFCAPGGYVDLMGYDISLTRAPIGPIQSVLNAFRPRAIPSSTPARATGRTSATCRPTSAGAPADRRRHRRPGPCGRILVRGEPGWEIISELAPEPGEAIIDKPGKGSFVATDFDLVLQTNISGTSS